MIGWYQRFAKCIYYKIGIAFFYQKENYKNIKLKVEKTNFLIEKHRLSFAGWITKKEKDRMFIIKIREWMHELKKLIDLPFEDFKEKCLKLKIGRKEVQQGKHSEG